MSGDWLLDWLSLARLPHIVDIGANPIDGDTPYKALIAKQLVKVTGFEPQEAALQVLNQRKTAMETYLPYVIGNGGKSTLNVCQYSGWTSLKKPRQAALEVFNQFKESAEIVETLAVTCKKLDSVHDASDIDMLKIDAQGAELDVLRGATKKNLSKLLGDRVGIPLRGRRHRPCSICGWCPEPAQQYLPGFE